MYNDPDAKQLRRAAPVYQDMPRDAGNPLPNGRPVMTIAPTLQQYMDEQRIRYELVPHEPTMSALGSAHAGCRAAIRVEVNRQSG